MMALSDSSICRSLALIVLLVAVAGNSGCGQGQEPASNSSVSTGRQSPAEEDSSHSVSGGPMAGAEPETVSMQSPGTCGLWPIPEEDAMPVRTMSVAEFETEYRTSSARFDSGYAGTFLEIEGANPIVKMNLGQEPMVVLAGNDERFQVKCVFLFWEDVEAIKADGTVRIQGVYAPSILPVLIHCRIAGTPLNRGNQSLIPRKPRVPEVVLTADQLEAEVTANPLVIWEKYAGKVMQVTGRLSRIGHAIDGEIAYRLDKPLNVQLYLRMGSPWWCCRPGRMVTVVGEGFAGYPCLVNCEVTNMTGEIVPIYTATELGESLEADAAAFQKQFFFRQIVVQGEVAEIGPPLDSLDGFRVLLRSTSKTSVACKMDLDELAAFESFKVGETVTLTGWNTKKSSEETILLSRCLLWRGE